MPKEESINQLVNNLNTLNTELTMDSTLEKCSALLAETLLNAMSILLDQREESCTEQATQNIVSKLDVEIENLRNKLTSLETTRDMIKVGKLDHVFINQYYHLPNHIVVEKQLKRKLNEYYSSNHLNSLYKEV